MTAPFFRAVISIFRLHVAFLCILTAACSTQQKAHLSVLDSGEESKRSGKGYNWDQVHIIGVDGRYFAPHRTFDLKPGPRTVTFSVSYIRGDMNEPIIVELPVSGRFTSGRKYQAYAHYKDYGMMGVFIQELDTSPEDYSLRAGALVYSREFDAYTTKSK